VFVVEHREHGRRMVAKLLRAQLLDNAQVVDRLRLESQALSSLSHPNIVTVLGAALTRDGRPYIIMEYLRGRTVAAELQWVGSLPPLDALHYARQLLSALAAAHAIGIVHRDIKPDNLILCDRPGAPPQLKVLDFSIARVTPGISAQAPSPLQIPTDTGIIVGTPRYISPEATLGHHVDHRADLYGVGVVLYHMLTGRGPFDYAKNHSEQLVAHLTATPEPPSRHLRQPLVAELDAAVLKALHKDPKARFQTAQEFDQVLASLEQRLEDAGDASGIIRTPPANSRFFPLQPHSGYTRYVRSHWRAILYVFVSLATAVFVVLLGMHTGWRAP
jgi:serine/threonine-protein kinase